MSFRIRMYCFFFFFFLTTWDLIKKSNLISNRILGLFELWTKRKETCGLKKEKKKKKTWDCGLVGEWLKKLRDFIIIFFLRKDNDIYILDEF